MQDRVSEYLQRAAAWRSRAAAAAEADERKRCEAIARAYEELVATLRRQDPPPDRREP